MAAPFLSRKSVVLGKMEVTYGTDPVPTVGANAILTSIPSLALDAALLERNVTNGSISNTQPLVGKKIQRANWTAEFKSTAGILAGSASAPIEIDAILRSSGFTATYTAEGSPSAGDGFVVYAPNSAPVSATYYVFNGQETRQKITGSYTNWTLDVVAGQYATLSVEVTGIYNEQTDTTAGAPTYATDKPVPIESISLAFGAVTGQVVRSLQIALNNEIVERPDVNSAEGLKGLRISGRKPTIRFKMEKPLVATWNIYNAMDVGTTYSVTFTIGSVAGQKILVTIPNFCITDIKESDENGIVMLDVEGWAARNSSAGDDELTFKFF